MAKKTYPAWQEVLLTALRCVPKPKDGHDAWSRLNEEEQAGVMVFLGEHCDGDPDRAKAMLEETIALHKRTDWKDWLKLAFGVMVMVAAVVAYIWLKESKGFDIHGYVMALLCALNLRREWCALPGYKMTEIWREHVDTCYGTNLALQDMYRHFMLPRKERVNKAALCFWAIALAVYIVMICMDIAQNMGISR